MQLEWNTGRGFPDGFDVEVGRGGSMINDTRIGTVALTETGKSQFRVVGGKGRDEFWTC